jgi:hypothetical protein
MSDQLVAEAATYTTHNKHKRRTSMPSASFEPAIPSIERPETHALETRGHRDRHEYAFKLDDTSIQSQVWEVVFFYE